MSTPSAVANQAVIAGIGTKTIPNDAPAITSLELQIHACYEAMKDAGVDRTHIGALYTGRAPMSYTALQWNMRIINELKLAPKYSSEVTMHGAGVLGTWQYAALMVANGFVDYALCCSGCMGSRWVDLVQVNAAIEADLQFEAPYGPTTPSLYAQWAQRYMWEFDVKPEDTAQVAVEARNWALHHPRAAMRDKGPITVEDVLASKPIADPMRLLDCSSWYKGGGFGTAVVITRPDLADSARDPIYISGFGQCATHEWVTERLGLDGIPPFDEPNLHTTGAKVAADDAYAMAGFGPEDVDLVESSAPFTFMNLMMIEDLGFAEKGEGKDFVRNGGIAFDGGLPYNTNGGYLSFGQAPNGMHTAIEAVQQLRGQAEGKQVDDARRALVHFHGGPMAAHSALLLSTADAVA
jgi:acetyl-CoA acetyltransferase